MKTINYVYGLRAPVANANLVAEQMRLAHVYRNRLCEIELARRAATDALLLELCPRLVEVDAAIQSADEEIEQLLAESKLKRSSARANLPDDGTKAVVSAIRVTRRTLASERKVLRDALFADNAAQAKLQAVSEDAASSVRASRAECGCYWGTYLIVEQAADSFRKGAPPKFARWRGEGRVGVQIQNGVEWDRIASGQDTRIQIVPRERLRVVTSRGVALPMTTKPERYVTLRLRVGSDGRDPIWAEWPMVLHRPIPDGAKVMWAVVSLRLVAGKPRWQVMLTLRCDESAVAKPTAAGGACGIDIGYRMKGSRTLRVACVRGCDGISEELCLPDGMVGEFERVERIQGHRDRRYHLVRKALRSWIASHDVPEWIREETEHMHAWRKQSRMVSLARRWRDERFDGDSKAFAFVRRWLTKENHLYQYQSHLRDQLLARRKDFYRCVANDLAKRYRTAYVERLDLRDIQDVVRPEDTREVHSNVRRVARWACLSQLMQCIKERFAEIVTVAHAHTSSDCSECGHRQDVGPAIRWTCGGCGSEWDRDDNAARNILARGEVMLESREALAADVAQGLTGGSGTPKKLSRSQKLQAARKRRGKSNDGK